MSAAPYEVGYKKPPAHTRFKKGTSGNPKGRSPGHLSLKTELLHELARRVDVVENGIRKKVPKQTLMIRTWVTDAAKGDARAREQILKLIDKIQLEAAAHGGGKNESEKDERILERFKARLVAELMEGGDVE